MLNLFRAVIGEVKSTVSYTMECRNLREYFDCTSAELELNGRSVSFSFKFFHNWFFSLNDLLLAFHEQVGEMDESCSGFELMHSHAYAEFVVLATFACPAMIFDEEFIAFLQKILDQSFIIVLFRDLVRDCLATVDNSCANNVFPYSFVQYRSSMYIWNWS